MISLSTITQNSSGTIVLNELPETSLSDTTARISRTATLDGGVIITHSGFAHGDRTFSIRSEVTGAEAVILEALHQTETIIWISCSEGFFSGAIDSLDIDSGALSMSILIKEKLSA